MKLAKLDETRSVDDRGEERVGWGGVVSNVEEGGRGEAKREEASKEEARRHARAMDESLQSGGSAATESSQVGSERVQLE